VTIASQSIRLILFEEAAHSVDDSVDFDTWQALPVIAGVLIAVATGKLPLQDDMSQAERPIPARV
jgi:hypothetical protein